MSMADLHQRGKLAPKFTKSVVVPCPVLIAVQFSNCYSLISACCAKVSCDLKQIEEIAVVAVISPQLVADNLAATIFGQRKSRILYFDLALGCEYEVLDWFRRWLVRHGYE